jgi:hypothetical protein
VWSRWYRLEVMEWPRSHMAGMLPEVANGGHVTVRIAVGVGQC